MAYRYYSFSLVQGYHHVIIIVINLRFDVLNYNYTITYTITQILRQ